MAWELTGNAGTTAADFLGTQDKPLVIKTHDIEAIHINPGIPIATLPGAPPPSVAGLPGNVGIGTTSPAAKLEVEGSDDPLLLVDHTGATGNPALWFQQDGASQAVLWWDRINNFLNLGTPANRTIVSLQDNGNVGIGTLIPFVLAKLHVAGSGNPLLLLDHTGAGNAALSFSHTEQDPGGDRITGADLWWDQDNNRLNVGTTRSNPIISFQDNGTVTVSGDIILSGSDFAEDCQVEASDVIEPGTVMVLDDNEVLRPSDKAYDKRVAGVISGAGDYMPGLILDRAEASPGRLPLALVGKVYCRVDATYGPIEVGDLLTTSPTAGHAMRADNPLMAFGAVIGKALRSLESGLGLIPILIALQ